MTESSLADSLCTHAAALTRSEFLCLLSTSTPTLPTPPLGAGALYKLGRQFQLLLFFETAFFHNVAQGDLEPVSSLSIVVITHI